MTFSLTRSHTSAPEPVTTYHQPATGMPARVSQASTLQLSGAGIGTEHLWYQMISLHQKYRCYHSARMDAAVEAWNHGQWTKTPSRSCLDLLNECVGPLPEDAMRDWVAWRNLDMARTSLLPQGARK
ncbi:unnamed protein product [Parascedosporium putredinis]|uniref:Uncharacterized protein n=1 Tax=Parascedosporium putredinis TaxID=1442378 RepID=A0A9P1GWN2_9PEZI|nr:unnamed protein product [Parascedosporium putredinis]CAI7988922.1 unnamed protein product [Parascedosporium putredinis]